MSRRDADAKDTTSPQNQKLSDFSIRLQTARGTALETAKVGEKESDRLGLAWRVGLEFIAAIVVGGGLGWSLDSILETKPLFMVVFLVLGGVAGTLNVYRISQGLDESIGLGQAKRRKEERPPGGRL